jgi:hypothetical protein
MANSKKFVVKNGLQTQNIQFVEQDGTETITATVLDDGSVSFSGSSGQLFSIVDSLTGSIFSVNDISGIPSIEVFDDGKVILAETNGNVGIGTASPNAKLEVLTSSNDDGIQIHRNSSTTNEYSKLGFRVSSSGSSLNTAEIRGVRTNRALANDTNLSFLTYSNGSLGERLTIRDDGNVGIGTTSPAAKLDVSGAGRFTGTFDENTSTAGTYIGYTNTPRILFANSNTLENWQIDNSAGNLRFFKPGSLKMLINGDGNVGINVTNPTSKLHISGNARIEGNLTVNGTITQVNTSVENTEQLIITNDGTGPAIVANQTGSQPVVDFQDDGVSALYIANGGLVGINTTAPSAKLDVTSPATYTGFSLGSEKTSTLTNPLLNTLILKAKTSADMVDGFGPLMAFSIRDNAGDDNTIASITATRSGADTSGRLAFRTANSGVTLEKMTILPSGNVGIGISNPTSKLDIYTITAGGATLAVRDLSTDGYPTINLENDARTWTLYNNGSLSDSFDIYDATAAQHRLVINSSGNVGIGTTSPENKLHVAGGSNPGVLVENTSNGNKFFSYSRNGTTGTKYSIFDVAAGFDRFGIDGSGNVGIGTVTPAEKLEVNGKIKLSANLGWGKSLIIGGNANNGDADTGSIGVTNGNLHIDAATNSATYLNFYKGTGGTTFGDGAGNIVAWMGPDGDLWKGTADNTGSKYWHAGNDGAGSGLDADLLDGLSSASFLRKDVSDVAVGNHEFYATDTSGNYDTAAIEVREVNLVGNTQTTDAYAPSLAFHWGGIAARTMFLSSNGEFYTIGSTSGMIWHEGNDGPSSGMYAGRAEATNRNIVFDVRDTSKTPAQYNAYRGIFEFNNLNLGGSTWWGIMTVKGWEGSYAAWQLAGPASVGENKDDLYFRGGQDATWGSWRRMIHDGNYSSYALPLTGGNITGNLNASGNVGIGTTSPSGKFDILGSGQNIFKIRHDAASGGDWAINPYIVGISNAGLSFTDVRNGTTPMVISDGGNVGIGTTQPGRKLDVNSASRFRDTMFFGASESEGLISWNTNGFVILGQSGKGMAFGANGANNHMYINTSGNVGIGTLSPTNTLSVAGSIESLNQTGLSGSTSEGGEIILRAPSGGSYRYLLDNYQSNFRIVKQNDADSSNGAVYMFVNASGNVGIGNSSPVGKLHIEGVSGTRPLYITTGNNTNNSSQTLIEAITDNAIYPATINIVRGADSSQTSFAFNTSNGPSAINVERMRIASDGNVGIGTTSPEQQLEIKSITTLGTASGTLQLSSSWDNPAYTPGSSPLGTINFKSNYGGNGSGVWGQIQVLSDGQFSSSGVLRPTRMTFSTTASGTGGVLTERMRITSGGNIGIGTTSPNAKLDVDGGVDVRGNLRLTGSATTTNQSRTIEFTGFDKEGTTDFSDNAYIRHTVNSGGLAGSVLEISSQNDADDGINFLTNGSNTFRHNGSVIITSNNIGSQSVSSATTATTATNSNALGGFGLGSYLIDDGWNNHPGQDANTQPNMKADFTYSNNAPHTGSLIGFGAGNYQMQLNGTYSGQQLSFRNRNGDTGTWNTWREIIHAGNIGSQSVSYATTSSQLHMGGSSTKLIADGVWAGAGGYPGYQFTGGNSRFGFSSTSGYIDVYTDGNFYAGIDLNGSNNLVLHSGNFADYAVRTSGQSNWSSVGTIGNVVGLLAWKNYGNSHVIFDASNSTSPSGTSVNSTNSAIPWSASYPTLMGWNGGSTYGVRVDSARVADSASSATSATSATRATDANEMRSNFSTATFSFQGSTFGSMSSSNFNPVSSMTKSLGTSSAFWLGVWTCTIYRTSESTLSDVYSKKDIKNIIIDGVPVYQPELLNNIEVTQEEENFFEGVKTLFEKLTIYTYNHIGSETNQPSKIGIMAQEIEEVLESYPLLLSLLIEEVSEDIKDENDNVIDTKITKYLRTDNLDTLKTIMIKYIYFKVKNLEEAVKQANETISKIKTVLVEKLIATEGELE